MRKKPKFGEWVSARYPPSLGIPVLVCREGEGNSFEAHRHKDKDTKQIYWTNAVWSYRPIPGITHWMEKPPGFNSHTWKELHKK